MGDSAESVSSVHTRVEQDCGPTCLASTSDRADECVCSDLNQSEIEVPQPMEVWAKGCIGVV